MQSWRMLLGYHGKPFMGFQRQPQLPSVQGELEQALQLIFQTPIPIFGAGRTDTGVHAVGQVVHCQLPDRVVKERLQKSLNRLLAPHIVVTDMQPVPSSFHARYTAIARRYCYRLLDRPVPDPLRNDQVYWVPEQLDRSAMSHACSALIGKRDFAPFIPPSSRLRNNMCDLQMAEFSSVGDEIHFHTQADRFLRHMVRSLIGVLLAIGTGKLSPDRLRSLLDGQQRDFVGTIAPAHGLCLMEVLYPPEYRWSSASTVLGSTRSLRETHLTLKR